MKLKPSSCHRLLMGDCCAFQVAYLLAQYQYFVCPVEYNSETNRFVTECEPSELFQLQKYSIPPLLQVVLGRVSKTKFLKKSGIWEVGMFEEKLFKNFFRVGFEYTASCQSH